MSSPLQIPRINQIIVVHDDSTKATIFTSYQISDAKDVVRKVGYITGHTFNDVKKQRAIERIVDSGIVETPQEAYILLSILIA